MRDSRHGLSSGKPLGRRLLGVTIAAILAAPVATQAGVLEEIIVTAQKKEENLQDVGVSVSAFSGDQLRALGWNSSDNVAAQVPGMVATTTSGDANVTLFSIRGINQGDYTENQEAPIAVYLDEAYNSSPGNSSFPIYDMQRVEVLRGPQGTLYGRNATGGLVHFITNKPSAEPEASVDVTLGSYSQRQVIAVLNGALSDKVQGRIAGFYNKNDGYIKNLIGPDLREDDTSSLRAHLNIDISENQSLLLSARTVDVNKAKGGVYDFHTSQVEADGIARWCNDCGYWYDPNNDGVYDADDGDGDPNKGSFDQIGYVDRQVRAATAKYTGEFDNFTLVSVTDAVHIEKDYFEEDDSTQYNYFTYSSTTELDQFSQELRLSGEGENMRWIVGGYYLEVKIDLDGEFPSPANEYWPHFATHQETKSWAVFGQVEYDLTDSLTLIGGLRWNDDDKNMDYRFTRCDSQNGGFAAYCPANGVTTDPVAAAADPNGLYGYVIDGVPRHYNYGDGDYSGKIQLDWHPSDDHLIYVSVSRGLKSGGFNASLDGFLLDDQVAFDREVLLAYEIGHKSTFLDGALRLNSSAYFYDYSDYQGFFFQGTTNFVVNHDAEMKGAETELVWMPAEGWDIMAGVSILDATVFDVPIMAGVVRDQNAILAPDYSFNGMIRKEWDIGGPRMAVQLSGRYVDDQEFNTVNHETTHGDGYHLFDARISYFSADDKWQASLFAKNLTDEEPQVFAYDISAAGNYSIRTFGPPRWIGFNVHYEFF